MAKTLFRNIPKANIKVAPNNDGIASHIGFNDLADFQQCWLTVGSSEYDSCEFLAGCNFSYCIIVDSAGQKRPRLTFKNCSFTDVNFRSVSWRHQVSFYNCTFNRCDFTNSTWHNKYLEDCQFYACDSTTNTPMPLLPNKSFFARCYWDGAKINLIEVPVKVEVVTPKKEITDLCPTCGTKGVFKPPAALCCPTHGFWAGC